MMCDKCYSKHGPRHFDAQTGGSVDCLPPTRQPFKSVSKSGHCASAASERGLVDAQSDVELWLLRRPLMSETGCLTIR